MTNIRAERVVISRRGRKIKRIEEEIKRRGEGRGGMERPIGSSGRAAKEISYGSVCYVGGKYRYEFYAYRSVGYW